MAHWTKFYPEEISHQGSNCLCTIIMSATWASNTFGINLGYSNGDPHTTGINLQQSLRLTNQRSNTKLRNILFASPIIDSIQNVPSILHKISVTTFFNDSEKSYKC